jgi:DNA transformation protein
MKSSHNGEDRAVHLADLLAPLGNITHGRFFGGHGLKANGVQFAMIIKDTLYFRTDESLAANLKRTGSRPFSYKTKLRTVTVKKYYSIQDESLDEPDQILEWARLSLAAATQAAKAKKPKK